jgi:hypothetical protein
LLPSRGLAVELVLPLLVLPPLADEPRGTACPSELPPPFELPPRRCWSARSDRGARIGWLGALFPIQPAPALDDEELSPALDAAGDDEEDEDEEEADPPLSRGTADPTVSPFDERDPACPAQAGASPSVKADAISPTVNF